MRTLEDNAVVAGADAEIGEEMGEEAGAATETGSAVNMINRGAAIMMKLLNGLI